MSTIVVVAAVQLALLAIWVLTSALMRSADLRRSELRVARLRGFPLPTLLAVSITEPAALCAIGVVLGILGAWGVVLLAASILFTSGTTVGLDVWTFVGFGAVVLTICAVLGLSSMRLLRSFGLASSSPQSRGSTSRLVVDISILAVSVVALLGAATSGALSSHSNPVAAAAPAVIALGTSVIAIRIVEYLCRRLIAPTRDSSRVALFLAVRAGRPAADGTARRTDSGHRRRSRLLRSVRLVGRESQSAHRRDVLDRCAHRRHRRRECSAAPSSGRHGGPTGTVRHGGDADFRAGDAAHRRRQLASGARRGLARRDDA